MNKKFDDLLEKKIISLYIEEGYTKKEISEICLLNKDQVNYILSKNKINKKKKYEDLFEPIVNEYLTTDCSYRDLSKKYNIPDYKIEHYFGSRKIKRDKKYIEDAFVVKNENSAYWIGFIAADGSLSDERHSIEIGLQIRDIDHLKKFSKFTTYKSNLKISIRENTNSCRITAINSKIYDSVKKYNLMPNKSFKIRFNDIINNFDGEQEMIRHFIRGYFDGDGSIYYKENLTCLKVSFCGNNDFLSQLKEYLESLLNICMTIYSKNGTDIKSLVVNHKKDAIKLLDYMYYSSKVYLDRKYNKYAVLVGNN